MRMYSYLESTTKHLLLINSDTKFTLNDFNRELNSYWKEIRINFIDINTVEGWMIEILKKLVDKNSSETVVIYVTSYSLSIYFSQLGINHIYLSTYSDGENFSFCFDEIKIKSNYIDGFLDEMYKSLGKDFRNYNGSLVERTIEKFMIKNRISKFDNFKKSIFYDKESRNNFLDSMSINFSCFFRDKVFFRFLREDIFNKMESYYRFNIWSSGCSNGKEAYSAAIVLYEIGLLDKAYIYATDFNESILQIGRNGMYPKSIIPKLEKNYKDSGGKESIWKYFNDFGSYVEIKDFIKKRVLFFNHDLTNDGIFKEFNIILCRNVLIYFKDELKKKVLKLFYDSMSDSGYLCLGNTEDIHLLRYVENFILYKPGYNIYRKSIEGIMEVGKNE